jgi:hypothetical protein
LTVNYKIKRGTKVQTVLDDTILDRLEEFIKVYHARSAASALKELIVIGLDAVENMHKVKTPEQVIDLERQFEHSRVVEYFQEMDQKQLEILSDIVAVEMAERLGKKASHPRRLSLK